MMHIHVNTMYQLSKIISKFTEKGFKCGGVTNAAADLQKKLASLPLDQIPKRT